MTHTLFYKKTAPLLIAALILGSIGPNVSAVADSPSGYDCTKDNRAVNVNEALETTGEVSDMDVSGGDTAGADMSGINATETAVSDGDTPGCDVTDGNAPGSDVSDGDVSDEDVSDDDTSGEDVSGCDVSGGDVSGGDVSGGDEIIPASVEPDTASDIDAFPSSYKAKLQALKAAHPNWNFVAYNVDLDWSTLVANELIHQRSLIYSSFPSYMREWLYGSNWYYASEDAVKYYLDPRNALDENHIFEFEVLSFNGALQTESAIDNVLSKTFMSSAKGNAPGTGQTYANIFFMVGSKLGISPFHLASRVIQEQGVNGSSMVSGTYTGYVGYYNHFNIGATGSGTTALINGLKYARDKGWNNAYKSIYGGASTLTTSYISQGQDTLYLQKFDVVGTLYTHQYMQNLTAPTTESVKIAQIYKDADAMNGALTFKIPVYKNMPRSAVSYPTNNTNVYVKLPSGYSLPFYVDDADASANTAYRNYNNVTNNKTESNSYYAINTKKTTAKSLKAYKYDSNGNVTGIYYWSLAYTDNHYVATAVEPSTPVKISAIGLNKDGTGITVSWGPVSGITSYAIYRSQDGGSFKYLTKTTTTTYTDKSMAGGHSYKYKVCSYINTTDNILSSDISKAVFFLSAPKTLTLRNAANGITVTWSKVSGAEGYIVYRSKGSGSFVQLPGIKTGLSFTDTDATGALRKYRYYIVSVATYNGEQVVSKTKSPTSAIYYLEAPSGIKITGTSNGRKITWKSVRKADSYVIYRSVNGSAFKKLTTVSTNRYIDKKATADGSVYTYRIIAQASAGGQTYSSSAAPDASTLVMTAPALSRVYNFSSGSLSASWTRKNYADQYEIMVSTNKYFAGASTYRTNDSKQKSLTISGQTLGKTYYIKVRTLATGTDGNTVYSPWSAVRSCKVTR